MRITMDGEAHECFGRFVDELAQTQYIVRVTARDRTIESARLLSSGFNDDGLFSINVQPMVEAQTTGLADAGEPVAFEVDDDLTVHVY